MAWPTLLKRFLKDVPERNEKKFWHAIRDRQLQLETKHECPIYTHMTDDGLHVMFCFDNAGIQVLEVIAKPNYA